MPELQLDHKPGQRQRRTAPTAQRCPQSPALPLSLTQLRTPCLSAPSQLPQSSSISSAQHRHKLPSAAPEIPHPHPLPGRSGAHRVRADTAPLPGSGFPEERPGLSSGIGDAPRTAGRSTGATEHTARSTTEGTQRGPRTAVLFPTGRGGYKARV